MELQVYLETLPFWKKKLREWYLILVVKSSEQSHKLLVCTLNVLEEIIHLTLKIIRTDPRGRFLIRVRVAKTNLYEAKVGIIELGKRWAKGDFDEIKVGWLTTQFGDSI